MQGGACLLEALLFPVLHLSLGSRQRFGELGNSLAGADNETLGKVQVVTV